MSQEEFMTEEEMEKFGRAMAVATTACTAITGSPKCAVVFGATLAAAGLFDWLWEDVIPSSWKAVGVFDYHLIVDQVRPEMENIHQTSMQLVDTAWHETRKGLGLPPMDSMASTYLNDWVSRNGWQVPGRWDLKANRWIQLVPQNGPWEVTRSPWPKRASEQDRQGFFNLLMVVYEVYRLFPLQAAVQQTLRWIAFKLSGTEYKADAGPIKEATWVHGNIAEAEYQDRLVRTERQGWGTTFIAKPGTENWFHIPISVPVMLDDTRPILSKIFVLYKTRSSAPRITAIHLYDGKHKIRAFDHLGLTGDHGGIIDASNSWFVYPHPTIYSGLEIAVGVQVSVIVHVPGSGSSEPLPEDYGITFTTAGADFNRSQ